MNEQMRDDEIEIDLREVVTILIRKIWLIVLCMAIGVAAVGAVTITMITPQYSASSMIYILTKTTSVTSLADLQMGTQLTVDFQTLATSRPVVESVIEQLNLDAEYEDLVNTITVENPTDTRILKTTVENPDPQLAMDISNAMSDAIAAQVAEVMTTDKPTNVERAVLPKSPSSPNLVKNIMLGALLGAFLAIAFVLVRYFMDDTIKNEDDVTKYLQLSTLAAIPMEKGRRSRKAS
ncbi:MAG: Wzz/FepE/Etk N-terminal domain-containing protein [Lachnospiraceae bacterium]|nr:Wzz/FepE/Etk N-terminal domain-containing protein [Lachnospiraceae bacterium]MDD3615307.1 Wzz/FepE/Etk N-terminal domain-containing protein [Lachnospiraceae bacterium]